MPKRLIVTKGPDKGQIFPLVDGNSILLGRGRQATSRLNDPRVSRTHCEIVLFKTGRISVTDLDSQGGTHVNGEQVTEHVMKVGDILCVGDSELRLEEDYMDAPTLPPDRLTRKMAESGLVPQEEEEPLPVRKTEVAARSQAEKPPARAIKPIDRPLAARDEPAAPTLKPKRLAPPTRPLRPAVAAPPSSPALPAPVTLAATDACLHELAGTRMAHFEIGSILARGLSGLLFQAHDVKAGRTVALKVLFPEATREPEEVNRFVRAMKTMLPIKHPNIVELYGAGKTGPYCWVSMEYVKGGSLAQVIEHMGAAGMLDWRKSLRIAVYIARGLEFAHSKSIIHRNITPNNVLVGDTPEDTKLGDLMLAKALEGKMAQQITKVGEVLGDVRYMPPERVSGGKSVLDGRSDLYALGALIYTLLAGRPAFDGPNMIETVTKICRDEPVRPKKFQMAIPDMFEGVVMRLLRKRPEDRHHDATDLLQHLERVAFYQGVKL